MKSITLTEGTRAHVLVEGVSSSYAGATVTLAGGPVYGDTSGPWAQVQGADLAEGEVADYTLPLPALAPGYYQLDVYADAGPLDRARLMTRVIEVENARYVEIDPGAAVPVGQGTASVRDGRGDSRHAYVVDEAGTRLADLGTARIATGPVMVVEGAGAKLPTDELGRIASVVKDVDGEVPLRSLLDALSDGVDAIPTDEVDLPTTPDGRLRAALTQTDGEEVDVASLIASLAETQTALMQRHTRLQGEHSDVLGKLGNVLDALAASKVREEELAAVVNDIDAQRTEWQSIPDFASDGATVSESARVETQMPPMPFTDLWLQLSFVPEYIQNVNSGTGTVSFRFLGWPFTGWPVDEKENMSGANFTSLVLYKEGRDGQEVTEAWPAPYYHNGSSDAFVLVGGGAAFKFTDTRFRWIYR